jgi:hypothetical protein
MAESTNVAATPSDAGPEQEILRAIASIQYGSVEVTIHEGRIVQIECREKTRWSADAPRKTAVRPIR